MIQTLIFNVANMYFNAFRENLFLAIISEVTVMFFVALLVLQSSLSFFQ